MADEECHDEHRASSGSSWTATTWADIAGADGGHVAGLSNATTRVVASYTDGFGDTRWCRSRRRHRDGLNNTLTGTAGDDILLGLAGADTLTGGAGE